MDSTQFVNIERECVNLFNSSVAASTSIERNLFDLKAKFVDLKSFLEKRIEELPDTDDDDDDVDVDEGEKSDEKMEEDLIGKEERKMNEKEKESDELMEENKKKTIDEEFRQQFNTTNDKACTIFKQVLLDKRAVHSSINRVSKAIDKTYVVKSKIFDTLDVSRKSKDQNSIFLSIHDYLLRFDMFDAANALQIETSLSDPSEKEIMEKGKKQIEPLNQMVKDLLINHSIDSTTTWIENMEKEKSSEFAIVDLLFNLKKNCLLEMVERFPKEYSQKQILCYSRNFSKFSTSHTKEVQELMGMQIYLRSDVVNQDQYRDLFNNYRWYDLSMKLRECYSNHLQIPIYSPLSIAVECGSYCFAAVENLGNTVHSHLGKICDRDELPIDVNDHLSVCEKRSKHSIFSCPILKQQTTEFNPAVRLECGHAISKEALVRLTHPHTNRRRYKRSNHHVKCPYCPKEINPENAKLLKFC
ncbi:hypothetical protein SNEBB_002414 [Seison nebaliae]|nr:hypothetical protein SNEBB_002414 [Seison nebaliae]